MSEPNRFSRGFARFSGRFARWTGHPAAFVACCAVILVWAFTGPVFHYSDTWQLIINTGTTIVTFLMVFLIQNTQNRDGAALQAKLDELVRALHSANDKFIGIDKLSEEEVDKMRKDGEAAAGRTAPRRRTHKSR